MWDKKEFQSMTMPILLLQLLSQQDQSGLQLVFQIRKQTNGAYNPCFGSLLPAIYPLVEEGCISSYRTEERRCYRVEPTGKKRLASMLKEYQSLNLGIDNLLSGSAD